MWESVDGGSGERGGKGGGRASGDRVMVKRDIWSRPLQGDIMSTANLLSGKADRFVFGVPTNNAESYMNLVARFSGGKLINRSQQDSYQHRCQGAALSHFLGPNDIKKH